MTEVCEWLENDFVKELYPLPTEDWSQSYWKGSEAGRLGLYDRSTDWSVIDWDGSVEGADEQITSFRPEVAGLGEGLCKIRSDEPASFLVDNESVLRTILSWYSAKTLLQSHWQVAQRLALQHSGRLAGRQRNEQQSMLSPEGTEGFFR
eukprot:1398207-Rhodomonas_salina.3